MPAVGGFQKEFSATPHVEVWSSKVATSSRLPDSKDMAYVLSDPPPTQKSATELLQVQH